MLTGGVGGVEDLSQPERQTAASWPAVRREELYDNRLDLIRVGRYLSLVLNYRIGIENSSKHHMQNIVLSIMPSISYNQNAP